ncbi:MULTISPECIES: hypothetical protein [Halorussus]|uniref:hypothetical protein n=1 Tax=Halorussus TaxID=1070314 RepID=UPI00209C7C1B|nr:hypothetical protein [Halorussus vallis]USZ74102.1 hypothetical protein NGM07_11620 [Halorussus vallis]
MASRRSFLRDLALLLPALGGCSANRSPTAVCTVGLRNFDRERHRFHVQIAADGTTLWERETTVPGRTDDAIPGPLYEGGLPNRRSVYTIRARTDDSP